MNFFFFFSKMSDVLSSNNLSINPINFKHQLKKSEAFDNDSRALKLFTGLVEDKEDCYFCVLLV